MLPRLISALFVCSIVRASADTFVVTNTLDSGFGSLRQAVANANAHPNAAEPDAIHFNILSGDRTIVLGSALPEISEPVIIDGWSQPGWNGVPLIALTAQAGLTIDGLVVSGGGTTIRGLAMNGFRAAINITQNGNNIVKGCYLGTDQTGQQPVPNDSGVVSLETSNNVIGGPAPTDRNIISGNRFNGIYFSETDAFSIKSSGNIVQGNFVGTDVTGTKALPNGTAQSGNTAGITLISNSSKIGGSEPGAGNLISGNIGLGVTATGSGIVVAGNKIGTTASGDAALGNTRTGLLLSSSGGLVGGTAPGSRNLVSGNGTVGIGDAGIDLESASGTIQGNFVGTDITGKIALPNRGTGISIGGWKNIVGGSMPGAGNLVAGNTGTGVSLHSGFSSIGFFSTEIPAQDNIVQGNLVGTDVTGMVALPNGGDGVWVGGSSGATRNRIGGTFSGARNVISGNLGNGINVSKASQTAIQRNLIGTGQDETTPLGNGQQGILLVDASGTIGAVTGANLEAANTIAFNGGNGIGVTGTTQPARISSNSIHDNGQLGIYLESNSTGVKINLPVITAAFANDGKLTIYGTFAGAASKNVTLEFFADSVIDPSGYGEGRVFLGQAQVMTDSSGNASFNVTFPLPPNVSFVSATSLDSGPNTSDFSKSVQISSAAPSPPPTPATPVTLPTHADQLLNLSTRLRVESGQGVLIGGFIVGGNEPKKIVVRALGPSLAAFNLPGLLADPVLELHDQSGQLLARNDNWRQDQETEIQQSGLAPSNDHESAIVRTVSPGNYTAIVGGTNGGTGLGLVEVYDIDQAAQTVLGNVSTRGLVGTGDNVMISGLTAGGAGGAATTVLIRGLGPSLASVGVENPLADPSLELRDANGTLVQSNDNFVQSQRFYEIKATGFAPDDFNHEAVILFDVSPGTYTAILRGASNSTGIGLLEIYNLR